MSIKRFNPTRAVVRIWCVIKIARAAHPQRVHKRKSGQLLPCVAEIKLVRKMVQGRTGRDDFVADQQHRFGPFSA